MCWRTKHPTNDSISPKVKLSFLYHTLRWHLRQFSLKNKIHSDSLLGGILIGVVHIILAKQVAKVLQQLDFLGQTDSKTRT